MSGTQDKRVINPPETLGYSGLGKQVSVRKAAIPRNQDSDCPCPRSLYKDYTVDELKEAIEKLENLHQKCAQEGEQAEVDLEAFDDCTEKSWTDEERTEYQRLKAVVKNASNIPQMNASRLREMNLLLKWKLPKETEDDDNASMHSAASGGAASIRPTTVAESVSSELDECNKSMEKVEDEMSTIDEKLLEDLSDSEVAKLTKKLEVLGRRKAMLSERYNRAQSRAELSQKQKSPVHLGTRRYEDDLEQQEVDRAMMLRLQALRDPEVQDISQEYYPQSPRYRKEPHNFIREVFVGEPPPLPSFGGRPEEWAIFSKEFERTTQDYKIKPSKNITRLGRALKGSAREAVVGLLDDPDNIPKIMRMLEVRFGRSEFVVKALIQKVRDFKASDMSKPQRMVEFGTLVQQMVARMKTLKNNVYLHSKLLLDEIVAKLPLDYARRWIQYVQVHPERLEVLEEFGDWIEAEVETLVRLYQPVLQEEPVKGRRRMHGVGVHVAAAEEEAGKPKGKACPFCESTQHKAARCGKLKNTTALELATEMRLCFLCLGKHPKKDCKSKAPCGVNGCQKRHHALLHGVELFPKKDDKQKELPRKEKKKSSEKKPAAAEPECSGSDTEESGINLCSSKPLSVLPVRVMGNNGKRYEFAIMDSGANTTVIDEKLADELGLEGVEFSHRLRGVGGIELVQRARRVSFKIAGTWEGASWYAVVDAITIKDLGMEPYSLDVKKAKQLWPYLKRAKMRTMDKVKARLIIGEDNPHLTAHRELLERGEMEPMAKRTKLGWVLAGKRLSGGHTLSTVNYISEQGTDKLESLMKLNWSLDAFGVVPRPNKGSLEDRRAMEILDSTAKLVEGRWECGLLWRNTDVTLPESKSNAMRRLMSNERRMTRDPTYGSMYDKKMDEYLEKGFIRELSKKEAEEPHPRKWIIPHFGVQNVNKPGKLRLVFDAAAKSNGVSLNDALLPGPDLIRPLMSVLLNFRRHNIVITGDIEDMFHRILMRKEDQPSQQFLYRKSGLKSDEDVKTFAMQVMIFGACSSPASAISMKNRNASLHQGKCPEAARAIVEDFYVDDCLTGAVDEDSASVLRKEITQINEEGGFMIKKWLSNSRKVIESIPESYCAEGAKCLSVKEEFPTERVLGLWWNAGTDNFTFSANFKKIKKELLEGERPTKREMVSIIMSIFDPLGFIANFKVKGLMLLQRTWKAGVDWDDAIPDSIYEDWKEFLVTLKEIPNVTIPRCYRVDLHNITEVELHTVVDASEESYAAVCYLRSVSNDGTEVAFVAAKARVAPMKKITIPRLELMAALMGARLAASLVEELKVKVSRRYFWSDSKLVLTWIRSETLRYKEFIANRIGEIQDLTNPCDWNWIPTALNVADQATRFSIPVELKRDSLWLTGPLFLWKGKEDWPKQNRNEEVQDEVDEMKAAVFITEVNEEAAIVDGSRFSSFTRLVRVQAAVISVVKFLVGKVRTNSPPSPWQLKCPVPVKSSNEERKRYLQKLKKHLQCNLTSHIPHDHMEQAERMQVMAVQKEVFSGDIASLLQGKVKRSSALLKLNPVLLDGLLCVGGRIGAADVNQQVKHPPILPARHKFTELLVLKEHKANMHQGTSTVLNNLRQRYWVLEGRAAIRRICNACPECRVWRVKPVIPKMADLPQYRLSARSPPFNLCAVDYFGPSEVVVGRHREKRWGCIFVCMVTRAIHLEVAYSLSTDEMLMAFTRFIAVRGRPSHMYSDNGTNFVGANAELKRMFGAVDWEAVRGRDQFQPIQWHFIPPMSPHFAGAWERMVQTAKKAIQRTLKTKTPSDQVLLTVMKGAENVVNSRPLTYVSADPGDPESLTPNHFLRGYSDVGPELHGKYEERDQVLRIHWKRAQQTLDEFWQRWVKEYLPELQRRDKWNLDAKPIDVGDVIVLVDQQQPRNYWMKGIVTATFPGKDGLIRTVEITTADRQTGKKTTYKRGVDQICPLGLKLENSDKV